MEAAMAALETTTSKEKKKIIEERKRIRIDNDLQLNLLVENSDLKSVKILMDSQVNVNWKSSSGKTSIHKACSSGRFEIFTLLLEKGANVNYSRFRWQNTITLYL